jgi:putative ABC transport system substrate-binding protein
MVFYRGTHAESGLRWASWREPFCTDCCRGAASGKDLSSGCLPLTQHAPVNVAFLDELRRGGFIEGQNLGVVWRALAEHFDRMSLYAAELVKARVDVIATATDEAIRALQQVTKTIPIVATTDDMLGSGFVNSVSRPEAI